MNFEKNILNIKHTKNNKNNKESSGFSKLLTSVSKYISCVFKQNKSEIIQLQNIYKFKDIKNEYIKKTKINENKSKYNLSSSTIKLKSNINYSNQKLLDLPLSNLMENCQKIEIILSNKEDI